MAITAAELNIILTARDREFTRSMDRATKRVNRFERDTRRGLSRTSRSFDTLGRSAKRAGPALASALPAAAPILGAAGAVALLGTAFAEAVRNGDKLTLLEGRIEAITGSAALAESGVEGLTAIMLETGVSLDGAASAFTRFTQAGKAIGATQSEVLQLTDTLVKLGRIGGGTQQELTAGAVQLSQALASGQLRGDELRSVMENLPLVTEALASSLGVGIGKLREMAEAGELTSKRVFDALLSKSDETNRRFSELPLTVEVASGRMVAAWTRFSASIDDSIGLSRTLAGVLDGIAAKLDRASLKGRALAKAQLSEGKAELARLKQQLEAERASTPSQSKESQALFGSRGGGREDAFDAVKRKKRIEELTAQISALSEATRMLEQQERAAAAAAAQSAQDRAEAESAAGAEMFRTNQERERQLALMADIDRAALKAANAAEAALREASPLASDEDIARARAFAEETTRLSQARTTGAKESVDAEQQLFDLMVDQLDALRIRQQLAGKTAAEQAGILARERLIAEARRSGVEMSELMVNAIEDQAKGVAELTALVEAEEEAHRANTREIERAKVAQEQLAERQKQANEDLAQGLTNAALQASSFEDALKRVLIQLVEISASSFITGALNGKASGGSFLASFASGLGASLFSGGSGLGQATTVSGVGGIGSSIGAGGGLRVFPGATGFATGGPVVGKGGATSDSIPAMLSNGEFVVNAQAARRNRPTLDAINSGRTASQGGQQMVKVTVDAGPEFDVRVEQSATPVAARAIAQNNQQRDRTFRPRMMATQSEIEKDYR
jgi:tape measure domain-containing protein